MIERKGHRIRLSLLAFVLMSGLVEPVKAQPFTVSLIAEEDGAGLSLFWTKRPLVGFGVSHHQHETARWTFGTLRYGRRMAQWIASAELNLGAGRANTDFNYRIVGITITREVLPGRLYLELEDRYIDIDRLQGNLVRGGAQWLPSPMWMVSTSVLASTGGNLGQRYVSARIDRQSAPIGFLAGATVGRSEPGFYQQLNEPPPGTSREIFAGATFRTDSGKAMIVVSSAKTGDDDRLRALLSWTFSD